MSALSTTPEGTCPSFCKSVRETFGVTSVTPFFCLGFGGGALVLGRTRSSGGADPGKVELLLDQLTCLPHPWPSWNSALPYTPIRSFPCSAWERLLDAPRPFHFGVSGEHLPFAFKAFRPSVRPETDHRSPEQTTTNSLPQITTHHIRELPSRHPCEPPRHPREGGDPASPALHDDSSRHLFAFPASRGKCMAISPCTP